MKTKDRILASALMLFNADGATEVTTNDMARELKMSPGNLYFHFKNKEQIVREIFKKLAAETNKVWRPETRLAKKNGSSKKNIQLIAFVDHNLNLYWKYRFFHREMYILRKKDPELSKLWHKHLKRTTLMMIILYKHWVKSGHMIPIQSKGEMEFVGELLFVASNSFMQFFETSGSGQTPNIKTIEKARRHILRMLMPYLSDETKDGLEIFFKL
jgi:AcrR family transcriptional regulator